jgi:hypothetical protein
MNKDIIEDDGFITIYPEKYRVTPNVYDQANFDQMADRIRELEAKLLAMGEDREKNRRKLMNKETIDEYERMVKERDKLYILMLNTQKGSGARMMRDELYLLEANISKYMWVHGFTDDFRHDL